MFLHIIKNGRGAFLNRSLQVDIIVLVCCCDFTANTASPKIAFISGWPDYLGFYLVKNSNLVKKDHPSGAAPIVRTTNTSARLFTCSSNVGQCLLRVIVVIVVLVGKKFKSP